nr:RNA-directed DNA polymerase, eukaryota [Tanacetum cinerariifolium]
MISKSIFITNFPNSTTSFDLWNLCQVYGTVVDVYIPNRRSKAGKRFAFVRFIKVDNVDRLVGNLCTLWIGRMHLHANVVRFERSPLQSSWASQPIRPDKIAPSFASAVKAKFLNNVGVASWFNCLSNAQSDFVSRDRIVWVDIEGVPMHAWSRNTFYKIGSKWGEVLELEECRDDFFARKRICIKTKQEDNILEKFKIIVKGKIFVVRAKELFVWSLTFKDVPEMVYCSDDDSTKEMGVNQTEFSKQTNLEDESDSKTVSDTYFGDNSDELGNVADSIQPPIENEISNDPFNIYDLLNKCDKEVDNTGTDSSIPFPLGFTPVKDIYKEAEQDMHADQVRSNSKSEGCNLRILEDSQKIDEHFSSKVRGSGFKHSEGSSILEILYEMIKVGQTMGFSIDGCLESKAKKEWIRELNIKYKVNFLTLQETKMDSISAMEVKFLWGNSNFEHLFSEALGNSGGILCTSDPNVFHKEHHIISDNFVALRMEERWGSVFNVYRARAFNNFITNSGLVTVQLEGYTFTWAHPSATKMSKLDRFLVTDGLLSLFPHVSAVCLDRHLSNHRPILLREVITDYDATPFRLYHPWFSLHGFEHMVTHTWNSIVLNDSNGMIQFKEKLQILKKEIRACVVDQKKKQSGCVNDLKSKLNDIDKTLDQGGVNDDLLLSRMECMKQLHDIKTADAPVKGIMIDGEWVDDPSHVKDEFRTHFAARFQDPGICHGRINFSFPNRLNLQPATDLENPIMRDEIHNAVWGCGENKSPGPDGFTFDFFQGDPLAPYLFILIMESLHLSFSRVIDAGIFTGVRIDSSRMISHLFYADDVVFIGEWSHDNLKGIMVGGNMSLVKAWDDTVDKIKGRLSKWKLKTLSIEGRLTLLKSVLGSTPIYNMSLYKVPKTMLNSMEAIHRNFFNGIHDDERKELSASHSSTWSFILKEINTLKAQGVELISHCKIRVGNVADKMNAHLTSSFRRTVRGGTESLQLAHLLDLLGPVILSNIEDRWIWDMNGDGVFHVKDVRILLDEVSLDRLPTRSNLSRRGVVVPSLSCPICNLIHEDTGHLLFSSACDEFIKSSVDNHIPILSESEGLPEHMCDVPSHDNSPPLDVSKDQFEDFSESNEEFSSIDDDSFSVDKIDYVEASPPDSELVNSEVIEIIIPEVGDIDDDILLTIKDDILREKLLNVNLLIAKIKALNANPTPSFDCKTKSPSTSLNSLLEETNTFDNSLPEFKTFCFDVDISLPEYEAFHDDHVKEISSGSLTTHYDSSLYASFIFDLSINPFPPVDRSDFYEFTDELIPFISAPEYDFSLFKVEPN